MKEIDTLLPNSIVKNRNRKFLLALSALLVNGAMRLGLSGVALKNESGDGEILSVLE